MPASHLGNRDSGYKQLGAAGVCAAARVYLSPRGLPVSYWRRWPHPRSLRWWVSPEMFLKDAPPGHNKANQAIPPNTDSILHLQTSGICWRFQSHGAATLAFCRGAIRQHSTAEQFLQTSMKSFSWPLKAKDRLAPSTTNPCWITWSSFILEKKDVINSIHTQVISII